MRKIMLAGAAVATTLLLSASMSTLALASPAATHDVLTVGKAGGTNVAKGSILKASLKSKTKATFNAGSGGLITCKTSSFTAKVTKNPTKPGTASESVSSQKFSGCTASGSSSVQGVNKVTINNLPYTTTISDKTGDPVTVSKPKGMLRTTLDLKTSVGSLICIYQAKATHGSASNKTQTITFTNQKFSKVNSPAACPASGKFSATYGPVLDTSKKGDPHVFVN